MPRENWVSSMKTDLYGRVRTQHDVGEDLVVGHLDVADSDTQAKNLLELELDRRADLGDLVGQVLSMGHGGRELASWMGSQNTERESGGR